MTAANAISPAKRALWLSTLAKARFEDLRTLWDNLPKKPEWQRLKPPETGMVMVRGRIGGDGARFNVGEMTVTRCVVRLKDGPVGVGYVAGCNLDHAELVAVIDSLAQEPLTHASVSDGIVQPLALLERRRLEAESRKAAASKVEFFTVVRGE